MSPKMRMDDAAKAKMRQHVLAKTWEGIQLVFPIPTLAHEPRPAICAFMRILLRTVVAHVQTHTSRAERNF